MSRNLLQQELPEIDTHDVLKRLAELTKLYRAGLDIRLPKVTLFLYMGQSLRGYVSSYTDGGSLTLIQDDNQRDGQQMIVIQNSSFFGISFDQNDLQNKLLDTREPLPWNENMTPLDLKRKAKEISEELTKELGKDISMELDVKAKSEDMLNIYNLLHTMKSTLVDTASDDLGRKSINEQIDKVIISEADVTGLLLDNNILHYQVQLDKRDSHLSSREAVEELSELL